MVFVLGWQRKTAARYWRVAERGVPRPRDAAAEARVVRRVRRQRPHVAKHLLVWQAPVRPGCGRLAEHVRDGAELRAEARLRDGRKCRAPRRQRRQHRQPHRQRGTRPRRG